MTGRYVSVRVDTTLGSKRSAVAGTRLAWRDYSFSVGGSLERVGNPNPPALQTTLPLAAGLNAQVDADLRFKSLRLALQSRSGGTLLRSRSTSADLASTAWRRTRYFRSDPDGRR